MLIRLTACRVTLARYEWPPSRVCSFVCLLFTLVYCVEMAWDVSCPHYSTLPPTYWHMPFLPCSWGHACCDNESDRPVDTVLTSRQIRQFSPNFSLTIGSEAIEKWEGKDLFSPPSKSGGAFAIPALQLVPPLPDFKSGPITQDGEGDEIDRVAVARHTSI